METRNKSTGVSHQQTKPALIASAMPTITYYIYLANEQIVCVPILKNKNIFSLSSKAILSYRRFDDTFSLCFTL